MLPMPIVGRHSRLRHPYLSNPSISQEQHSLGEECSQTKINYGDVLLLPRVLSAEQPEPRKVGVFPAPLSAMIQVIGQRWPTQIVF